MNADETARFHGCPGQPALPRHDDVRRVGRDRPRRVVRIIDRALDAGINFIDTADVYSRGESEEIVGKALAKRPRDDVVLATKCHGAMGDDPNQRGNSRRWIVAGGREQLRRLGTDWIDLYQIHRPDPDTDIEETLGALTDLVRQGKVRYIGCSTFPRLGRRRGAMGGRAARPRALRHASSLRTRCSSAASRRTCCPTVPAVRHGRNRLEPARRRLADRPLPQGPGQPESRRGRWLPERYDMSMPANQAQARRRRAAGRACRGGRASR